MSTPAPLLLTTWSFGLNAGRAAWTALASGGSALDAVEATCIAAEDDPGIDSVGYGGLPDRDGVVSLDGCIMLSPRRCGSVCCLRQVRHPVSAARQVMERTAHVMLAGTDADRFALHHGARAQELLAPEARAAWERWSAAPAVVDQSRDRLAPPRPIDRGPASGGGLFAAPPPDSPDPAGAESRPWNRHHDTIGVLALDRAGTLAGACSTSGTPYKLPGRVGDSPIIGHGLYVDPAVGGATATGAGELIMGICGSFLVVEQLRGGRTPLEAIQFALLRIAEGGELAPHHQVAFLALRRDGVWAAGALRDGYRTSCWSVEGGVAVEAGWVWEHAGAGGAGAAGPARGAANAVGP